MTDRRAQYRQSKAKARQAKRDAGLALVGAVAVCALFATLSEKYKWF